MLDVEKKIPIQSIPEEKVFERFNPSVAPYSRKVPFFFSRNVKSTNKSWYNCDLDNLAFSSKKL